MYIEEILTPDPTANNENSFVAAFILMDDEVKTVKRQVVTLLDSLKSTGGFMSVIFVFAFVLVTYL